MGRFKRQSDEGEKEHRPSACICPGCPLPPVRGDGFSKVALYCGFHDARDSPAKRDAKTARINRREGLMRHYLRMRPKTPVDLEMAEKAGEHPGLFGAGAAKKWDRQPDETWAEYKHRFHLQLRHYIFHGTEIDADDNANGDTKDGA